MGNYISEQLAMFLRSVALGATLGLIYDLLRSLRKLGGRLWGALLDGAYCLVAAASLFFFVMAGDGELRIFILTGALGGAVLFFCLLSQSLRPLWDFWLQILLTPMRLLERLEKKGERFAKKLFSFARKWVTMKKARVRGRHPPALREGEKGMKKQAKRPERQKNDRKRPGGKLTAFILIVLLIGIGVQLCHQYRQLQSARQEEAGYASALAELQEENQRLRDDIENRDNMELIEDIARDELGMAGPGEKVFIFSR